MPISGPRRLSSLALALVALASPAVAQTTVAKRPSASAASRDVLATLRDGQRLSGFRATSLYLDAAGRPIGARFVHERTRFTLDVVRQQSVPQGFVYVNTFPMTDQGEPHTQEHLLVAKGTKGRALGSFENAALVASNAFTQQWRTAYNFNTAAGGRAFYTLVERELDALLDPDYTDDEIRREVRNFGVSEDPATKALRLEEKGSVYNEMVSSTANPFNRVFRAVGHMTYGTEHPLARESGGTPEGIRTMKPEDIRAFHREHYHLSNMGMILSVPDALPVADVLANVDRTLVRLQGSSPARKPIMTEADLPAPKAAPAGEIRVVDYPHRNPQQPGPVLFAWPATRDLSVNEQTLLQLFVMAFAGDPTTNLYKAFVDTKTRTMDVGAKAVFASVSDDQGFPLYIGLNGVAPSHMTEAELAAMRTVVMTELRKIAALPDGSPELAAFEGRIRSRVLESRRFLSKFVNSPPGFGARNTGGGWLSQLDEVNRTRGFRKSLTLEPALAFADSLARGRANPWRTYLARWQLTTVTPYVIAGRPEPKLIEQEEKARLARAATEVARLRAQYGVSDDQEAIRRYRSEYDAKSAQLDSIALNARPERLVDDLPMTLDDQLRYSVDTVRGVPVVSSAFESMTSVTTGLDLGLDVVPPDQLVYVPALPALLTRVGTVRGGTPMSYEQMSERIRREILALDAGFSTNMRTGRAELVLRGSGNDVAEGRKALEWMTAVMAAPDWRVENLPRIRDLVDQLLAAARNTPQGSPESWVQGIANAYRRQDSPLLLATTAYPTRAHHLQRLRWLLQDAGSAADARAVDGWLAQLGAATAPRPELQGMLKAITDSSAAAPAGPTLAAIVTAERALSPAARRLAVEAARDLEQTLNEVPDESLAADWSAVVNEMRRDLAVPPATALATLDRLRQRMLVAANARAFVVGSSATRRAITPALGDMLGVLGAGPRAAVTYASRRAVDERLRARTGGGAAAASPLFVGLFDPNMQGGVVLNSAPGVTYADTARDALIGYLASRLYSGGGAHSVFSKTIAAGLAYSNGLNSSPTAGRVTYYAERTPEIPQTVSFVVAELKKSPHDTSLVDYALGGAFGEVRSANAFEQRGEAMANDLADRMPPASVRRFREKLLELRRTTPALGAALYDRMDSVYAQILPGYVSGTPRVPGAVYFVIGNDKQLSAWEKYLKSAVTPDARLDRIYPRDFWAVEEGGQTTPAVP